jgi:hypothetical protein
MRELVSDEHFSVDGTLLEEAWASHKCFRAKNDHNDAEAITTAARQGNMRFVPKKNIDQQARLSWHRVREGYKAETLAISNRLRGLVEEFGIVTAKSDKALRLVLADLHEQATLPAAFKELVRDLATHWKQVRMTSGACACVASSVLARSRPIRWSPAWARRKSFATVGNCLRGSAWCPASTPAADTHDWARSAVVAMATCARC